MQVLFSLPTSEVNLYFLGNKSYRALQELSLGNSKLCYRNAKYHRK